MDVRPLERFPKTAYVKHSKRIFICTSLLLYMNLLARIIMILHDISVLEGLILVGCIILWPVFNFLIKFNTLDNQSKGFILNGFTSLEE
jgi:hypothetical protein